MAKHTITAVKPLDRAKTTGRGANNAAAWSAPQLQERSRFWRRFSRHRLALLGSGILLVVVAMSVFGPILLPHDPNRLNLSEAGMPPTSEHWLGTDLVGRDVLARLLFAGRVSLSVGLFSVAIYLSIAIVLGGVAGYFRGWADNFIMRLTDTVMCFPTLVIIITIVALIGPSIYNVILVIGLLGWPWDTRLARAQFLALRESEFVLAGRCVGVRNNRIIFRHILPNAVSPLIVAATFGVAGAILLEAALSFLGLGVQPPMPSWGNMLNAAKAVEIIENMPWLWVPPGLMIVVCVLSINFIGDGLRDALDPRSLTD